MKSFLFSLLIILSTASASFATTETSQANDPHAGVDMKEVMAKASSAAVPHNGWNFMDARLIPVQSGGRIKPLDSFAIETILFETGSRSYKGWDATDLLFSWITFPHYWEKVEFIQVGRVDVRRQLGLDESRTRFSPAELFRNSALAQYADRIQTGEEQATPPGGAVKQEPRQQELRRVLERVNTFREVVAGYAWVVIPKAAPKPWDSLATEEKDGDMIRRKFAEMLQAYQSGDQAGFERTAKLARAAVEGEIPTWNEHTGKKLAAETLYNRMRPFQWAWILYLTSSIVLMITVFKKRTGLAIFLMSVAFLLHSFGFGLRAYVAERAPVTNMYESIVWVTLGVIFFAGILYAIQRHAVMLIVAGIVATVGLIAADAAPAMFDPSLNPLVPVLRSNYWLTVHVLTITLGYSALALALGISNVTLYHYLTFKQGSTQKIFTLNQMTYRATQFGVVLLAAGTILGGVWADASWGRFWGWDPKETWALIALLCYMAILHGRYTQWVGQFAFAVWSVIAFLSVIMAWYGVNFILGAGLHSYGFSSGGLAYVSAYTAAQLGYVFLVVYVHKIRKPDASTPMAHA